MSNQATLNVSKNMISYTSKSFPVQVQAALKLIDAEFVSKSGTQAVNDWLNQKGGAKRWPCAVGQLIGILKWILCGLSRCQERRLVEVNRIGRFPVKR